MPLSIEELDVRLDALQEQLPTLVEQYPEDGDFWEAFAGIAEPIRDSAGEHSAHVSGRIDCMLGSLGLIPGDNEGEPC